MTTPDFIITPVIAAARARKLRGRVPVRDGGEGGTPALENNYIAETPKKRAGARAGNRNAFKTGAYSAASRARREQVMTIVRQFRQRVDAVLAEVEPDRG